MRSTTHLPLALKGFKLERVCLLRQPPQVLDGLPAGHDPDVLHRDQGVEERLKADLVVRLSEPGGVVEKTKGSSEKCKEQT